MGWRDLIVSSHPAPTAPDKPTKGGFEYFEDFELNYRNKSSFSISNSSQKSVQISKPLETSSISSKSIQPTGDPEAPLLPGWFVAYRDTHGRLTGGADDRVNGTVSACTWDGAAWVVLLTNEDRLPLGAVVSVARTDADGSILAAWTVRGHGYRGDR